MTAFHAIPAFRATCEYTYASVNLLPRLRSPEHLNFQLQGSSLQVDILTLATLLCGLQGRGDFTLRESRPSEHGGYYKRAQLDLFWSCLMPSRY